MNNFEGLPPAEWWRLATIAEGRGITVRELLIERNTPPAPKPLTPLEQLTAELNAARDAGFRVPRRENPSASEDQAWRVAEKRRLNLESFRRMDTVWEVSA